MTVAEKERHRALESIKAQIDTELNEAGVPPDVSTPVRVRWLRTEVARLRTLAVAGAVQAFQGAGGSAAAIKAIDFLDGG